jgi:archaeal flagellin FlaB
LRGIKIVKTFTRGAIKFDNKAAIGIGSLIIFIAIILVAGTTASVLIQTMNNLEQQALSTSRETMRDISSGIKVSQVTGYNDGSSINQLAIFVRTTAGSESIDLSQTYISLSDGSKKVILNYTNNVFSKSVNNGLFGTINSSNLSSTTYGVIVIRDIDGYCESSSPVINNDDLVVLIINTSKCFSGINTRSQVSGKVIPEYGIAGVISFTTPSVYVNPIIELQT